MKALSITTTSYPLFAILHTQRAWLCSIAPSMPTHYTLPSLHKQEMHSQVTKHEEHSTVDRKADGVAPQRKSVETKGAQNS